VGQEDVVIFHQRSDFLLRQIADYADRGPKHQLEAVFSLELLA
jgi:hypothetical protein